MDPLDPEKSVQVDHENVATEFSPKETWNGNYPSHRRGLDENCKARR